MSGGHSTAELEAIARTVHEAIRAWSAAHGQTSIPTWTRAPRWMKESTLESVRFVLDHPDAPDSQQHDQWMAQKKREGWVWGKTKDATRKTHPMIVAYEELPEMERRKDTLVKAVVQALA